MVLHQHFLISNSELLRQRQIFLLYKPPSAQGFMSEHRAPWKPSWVTDCISCLSNSLLIAQVVSASRVNSAHWAPTNPPLALKATTVTLMAWAHPLMSVMQAGTALWAQPRREKSNARQATTVHVAVAGLNPAGMGLTGLPPS